MYNPLVGKLLEGLIHETPEAGKLDRAFQLRLHANFEDIVSYADALYGKRDHSAFFKKLIKSMAALYEQRPDQLKKIDEQRLKEPHWFLSEKWTGMMLYTDRFAKDLKDFKKKISYFEDLGVNLVHLMPLLKCPKENNDGGYAVSDFKQVNPDFGTMEDIADIANIFHKKDMLLMMDLAVNHTSNEHEWALKAREGYKEYQDYYYFFDNRWLPNQYEDAMPEVFPDTAPGNFTYIEELEKWVMTVFHDYQWDLNYTNPNVFLQMFDILIFQLNHGVDIIRLDALAFTWKKIGTDCQNLPEAHTVIKLFKACAQVVAPGCLFLAEAIVAPEKIVKYFGQVSGISNECDMAYNATQMTLSWDMIATKNTRLFGQTMDNVPQKPIGTTWLNYVRCHDDIGLGYEDQHAQWAGYDPQQHRKFLTDFFTGQIDWSFAEGKPFMKDPKTGNARISGTLASLVGLEKAIKAKNTKEEQLAIKRILLLHGLIMSSCGIPHLYMGDELGLLNDYSHEQVSYQKHDNRWIHRPFMDWQNAEKRKKTGTRENLIFYSLKKLIEVRKSEPLMRDLNNYYRPETHNQHVLAFERYGNDEKILCVFNLNDHPEPLYFEILEQQGMMNAGLQDIISKREINLMRHNLMLQPYEFLWLKNIK